MAPDWTHVARSPRRLHRRGARGRGRYGKGQSASATDWRDFYRRWRRLGKGTFCFYITLYFLNLPNILNLISLRTDINTCPWNFSDLGICWVAYSNLYLIHFVSRFAKKGRGYFHFLLFSPNCVRRTVFFHFSNMGIKWNVVKIPFQKY